MTRRESSSTDSYTHRSHTSVSRGESASLVERPPGPVEPGRVAIAALKASSDAVRGEVARLAALAGVEVAHSRAAIESGAVLRIIEVPGTTSQVEASFHPSYAPYFARGKVRIALPEQAEDLLELMLAAGSTRRGIIVGVVGAHGGAGCSTLASWLARGLGETDATGLIDLDPLSLGIETMGGVCTKLIDRNTTIPVKKSQIFSTAADNQTSVEVHVLQGEREMAQYNKTLGRFNLDGIAPARRGVPQIEVTFDIDANGIVNVSAKDMGTGKEQSIKITASSGLSEDDIQRLVREAETHATDDKKKQELIEARNHADSLIYGTEKSLTDLGDKADAALKSDIDGKIAALRKLMEGEDAAAIKAATEDLAKTSHKLAEQLYQQQAQQAGGQPGADAGAAGAGHQQGHAGDDVVDADYTEVKK